MAINSSTRSLSLDNAEGIVTSKNYVKSTFESGNTAGWSLFSTTLTNSLPSGTITAGASSLALGVTSTNPIEGTFSLQLTASGVATAGQGFISDVFTANNSDLGKVLNSKFSYNVVSGSTNLNFSGILGSQSISVAFYDVTAAAWIAAPAGALGMLQSSGYADTGPITFQTSVTVGQQYRMALYFSVASAGAAALTFDNFVCSKGVITTGAAMTDWVSHTPTLLNSWTNSTLSGTWKRVGDTMEIRYKLQTTGTPTGGSLSFNMVSGYAVDNAKLSSNGDGMKVGYGGIYQTGIIDGNLEVFINYNGGNTYFNVTFISSITTSSVTLVTPTNPVSISNHPDYIWIYVKVPIVGWSSNVQQSSDSDQRTVAAYLVAGGAQNIANSTVTGLTFGATVDTHGTFNGSTTYTIPVSGLYEINAHLELGSASTQSIPTQLFLNLNGSTVKSANVSDCLTASKNSQLGNYGSGHITYLSNLKSGDQITVQAVQYSGITVAANSDTYLAIKRLSGSAVVQATESVNASYTTSAAQSIAISGNNPILFDTKQFDTHNAYSIASKLYTFPISGKYRVSGSLNYASTASQFEYGSILIMSSGALYYQTNSKSGAANLPAGITFTYLVSVKAGDTAQIGTFQGSGVVQALRGDSVVLGLTSLFIERVGN